MVVRGRAMHAPTIVENFLRFLMKNKIRKGLILKMNKIKQAKGITFIALIITILVMVVIARSKYKYVVWTRWSN